MTTKVYIETQYDPQRKEIALRATVDGGTLRLALPAETEAEAQEEAEAFVGMYKALGCEVYT